jgi:teichuronic acid biosynthesis glycosyltransferase TuaG
MGNRISVIIPTWNRSASLGLAIQSVLHQTVKVAEVLVCDDGSTDNSFDVVKSINDARVRWVAGMRGGRPAVPRNRGIRESVGEWVAFLDDDDEWLPQKLEIQIAHINIHGSLAVCSNAYRILPGEELSGTLISWNSVKLGFQDMLDVNRVVCSSVLLHRSLFEVVKEFPEGNRLCAIEDYALWLRVATQTDFAYVSEPLLKYRDDPVSSFRKEGADVRTQSKFVLKDFLKWASDVKTVGPYRKLAMRHYRTLLFDDLKINLKALPLRLKEKMLSKH